MADEPKVSPRWAQAETVAAFTQGAPNAVLMAFAQGLVAARGPLAVLDIGCGAGRNALPLAALGCEVVGTDLSAPMVAAAAARVATGGPGREGTEGTVAIEGREVPAPTFVVAPMNALPFGDRRFDLVVAHGVWNLATSDAELRRALAEAARVARPGAALFLFTFSRHTLPPAAPPVLGERHIFTDFAGEPQCFLSEAEVVAELEAVGFVRAPPGPLTEYNGPRGAPGLATLGARGPAIWEGTFVRRGEAG